MQGFQGATAAAAAAFASATTPPPPEPSAASRRTTQAPPLSCREAPPLPPDEKALSQQTKGSGGRLQILDPITGEEVLPCIWRRQKSVRPVIRDPRTGEEMIFFDPDFKGLLRGVSLDETDEQSLDEALRKTGPSSKATAAASKGPQAVVSQDEDRGFWVLEPLHGGSWDWPLSRPEKKERVFMLSQMELLEEVEELRAAAAEAEGEEEDSADVSCS
ncbi:unnamed protein product [Polarella glacialis]|uniref:Uncharacterized protein n=1 Tax=Polarella glacialis TaxID=89957 RepID=A0A813II66_POLGL|nr:unnamed protein product [Polarella glacialis]